MKNFFTFVFSLCVLLHTIGYTSLDKYCASANELNVERNDRHKIKNLDIPFVNSDTEDMTLESCVNKVYDVILMVDESTSVEADKEKWTSQVIPTLRNFVDNLDLGKDKTHVALYRFSSKITEDVRFSCELSYNKSMLIEYIDNNMSAQGDNSSNVVDALNFGLKYYIHGESNRLGASKIFAVFTGGNESDSENLQNIKNVTRELKNADVKTIVVSMGDNANKDVLKMIVECEELINSCSDIILSEWNIFSNIIPELVQKVCTVEEKPLQLIPFYKIPKPIPNSKKSVIIPFRLRDNTKITPEPTPEPIPEPTPTPPIVKKCVGEKCLCENYYDLTLIIDESGSIGEDRWVNQVIPFVSSVVENLEVNSDKVHVGLFRFASRVKDDIKFDNSISYDMKPLLKYIESLKSQYKIGGTTFILDALDHGLIKYTNGSGNRLDAPKVTILFTDGDETTSGPAVDTRRTKIVQTYHEQKIKLMIVGVGAVKRNHLFVLGNCNPTDAECANVIKTDWANLKNITNLLTDKICDEPKPEPTPEPIPEPTPEPIPEPIPEPTPEPIICDDINCEECDDDVCPSDAGCQKTLHIALVLDESTNVSVEKWDKYVKPFATKIVNSNYLAVNRTHITLMKMKPEEKEMWKLTHKMSYKKNMLINKINNLFKYDVNNKDLTQNLKYLRENTFNDTPENARKVIILFLEGKSAKDTVELAREVQLLRLNKIDLFVYALDNIDEAEYKILGDCAEPFEKCEKQIVKVSWDGLVPAVDNFVENVCNKFPEDAVCSEWGEWSTCPDECNVLHYSKRERKYPYTIVQEGFDNSSYGRACMDLGVVQHKVCELKKCTDNNKDICNDYQEWSECIGICGEGIRIRHRNIYENMEEQCKDFNRTQIEKCDLKKCSAIETCEEIAQWSEWSACPAECGYHTKVRNAIITAAYELKYPQCKDFTKTEVEVCDSKPCPVEPCFEWGEWGEWSATCGLRNRVQHAILKGNDNNNNNNNALRNKKDVECENFYEDKVEYDESIPCELSICGEWSEWSACDKTCNTGMKTRHFVFNFNKVITSSDNPMFEQCKEYYGKTESVICSELPVCDEHENCGEWEIFRDCDETSCNPASKRIFMRVFKEESESNDFVQPEACKNIPKFKEENCKLSDACNINAVCSEWGEWSTCPSVCVNSTIYRKRKEPFELVNALTDAFGNKGLSCVEQGLLTYEEMECPMPSECFTDEKKNKQIEYPLPDEETHQRQGFSTGEKLSLAGGILTFLVLGTASVAYSYNTFGGGEQADTSNMEFENVENNEGPETEVIEDFEVVDANDPMWN